jgi:glycosyltransferase involved in cell wall biosynthesis
MNNRQQIETLVVTMNQNTYDLHEKMNIQGKAIISNQNNQNSYLELDEGRIKYINTNTTGVGKNRNIGLLYSDCDICLFADDDVVYHTDYLISIGEAFKKLPNADIIIFNIDTINSNLSNRRKNNRIKRVRYYNFLNYGTVRIAVKRKEVLKSNIWFTIEFGGGTSYSSGEDSVFLHDSLKNGLKIYTYPKSIGTVDQGKSTWFEGYNDKYFIDKGALIKKMFPKTYWILVLVYFSNRYSKLSHKGRIYIIKKMLQGAKIYKDY